MNLDKTSAYHIGDANRPWSEGEKRQWYQKQTVKRLYDDEVLSRLEKRPKEFELLSYGSLTIEPERYPLYVAKSLKWNENLTTALITGGVHGYETSGVQGAIRFLINCASKYTSDYNIVIAPCISPWAYETINRWNPSAIDPNRSFTPNSDGEESAALMTFIANLDTPIDVHIDLHETTNTDNTEFRPALAARDNVTHDIWDIPDGFYLVGDTTNPAPEFQAHIIQAVAGVTHIAEADASGQIIGEKITQHGVINYATKELGLCTGFTNSRFSTTTEVYPDSPKVDDENCIKAQVTAICSGLDYVKGIEY